MQDEEAEHSTAKDSAPNGSNGIARPAKAIGKNPHVVTDFLPDREREAAEEKLRQQLRMEYQLRQQVLTVLHGHAIGGRCEDCK